MVGSLAWAKRPMLLRVHQLPPSMPLTMVYGALSWVDSSSGDAVVRIRNQAPTEVIVSRNAGESQEGLGVQNVQIYFWIGVYSFHFLNIFFYIFSQ